MSRKVVAILVSLLVAIPARVLADDVVEPAAEVTPAEPSEPLPMPTLHMRLTTGAGTLLGPNGKTYLIPQLSHIVTGDVWNDREAELVRLQETEIRIQAENTSLRKATAGWQPGTYTLVVAFVSGVAGGWYLHSKLF